MQLDEALGGLTITEYIERAKALEAFLSEGNGYYNLLKLRDMINAIPAADVQPVKYGEWVSDKYGVHCSRCNKTPPTEEVQCGCQTFEDYILSGFCPHCGADMRGERNA